jgi:hypothetical protein
MKSQLLLFFFLSSSSLLLAQQPAKYSIPLRVNTGLNWADINHIQGTQLTQTPGISVEIESGIDVRLNDYWITGIGLRSGFLSHAFDFGSSSYAALYYLYPRFEGHLTRSFNYPKNKHSDPYFRLSYGQTWFDGSTLSKETELFSVDVNVARKWVPHIAPEIGLIKKLEKQNQMQLALTYFHSFSDIPLINFRFVENQENNPNRSTGFSNLNYLGLVVRYNFGLKEDLNDGKRVPWTLNGEVRDRDTRKRKEAFTFNQSRVVLELKDNAQVDGDSVSVRFNGKWVLFETPIDDSKKRVVLYLEKGKNDLLVFANNEGRISPNTVRVRLLSGFRRESLTISTSLDRNESVDLILK